MLKRFATPIAIAFLAMPATALAQSAPAVSFLPKAAAAAPAPSLSAQATQPDPMASHWEVIGGLEFDTDGMLYGFAGPQWTRPLNDDVALTARAYVNWLQYEFEENGGTTEVSGPGVSTQLGLKFGDRNRFSVGAGPSFKWRGETFTDAVIRAVSARESPVVFVLWGGYAQKKAALVDASRHTILSSAHPSPLSARNGFFGSRPFSKINAALRAAGRPAIDWQLPNLTLPKRSR